VQAEASITLLLQDWGAGNPSAMQDLYPRIYQQLRAIAAGQIRRWQGDATLGATDLVHEAYLKLVDQTQARWQDRAHFLAVAATAMRQILINRAERRSAAKRGGGWHQVSLAGCELAEDEASEQLLALEDGLQQLAKLDPRLVQVTEFRFFAGMSEAEIGHVLGVNERTVRRDWRKARAFLSTVVDAALA